MPCRQWRATPLVGSLLFCWLHVRQTAATYAGRGLRVPHTLWILGVLLFRVVSSFGEGWSTEGVLLVRDVSCGKETKYDFRFSRTTQVWNTLRRTTNRGQSFATRLVRCNIARFVKVWLRKLVKQEIALHGCPLLSTLNTNGQTLQRAEVKRACYLFVSGSRGSSNDLQCATATRGRRARLITVASSPA